MSGWRLAAGISGRAVGTLIALTLVTFLATNALPGDVARTALGRGATPEQLAVFRADQGLDRPVLARYADWLGNAVRGDWGRSLTANRPVADDLGPRIERTALLALAGFALGVPIALAFGLWSGQRAGSPLDTAGSLVVLLLGALPEFVIGFALLVLLAVGLGWFPVESSGIAFDLPPVDVALRYVLPALTLALVVVPYLLRMMRASTREVTRQPFVRAVQLRGIAPRRVTRAHVLPNALPPVVNVLALNLAELLSGVVVVEAVFGFPGAGQLLVTSVTAGDIPTVQALVLVMGGAFIALNVLADLAVVALTPTLRVR